MDKNISETDRAINYNNAFKELIDACGQVSYYWHMWHGTKEGVAKMEVVSTHYKRGVRYYHEQYKEWKYKALVAFNRFQVKAVEIGFEFPQFASTEKRDIFLNNLVLDQGRRDAYKDYLRGSRKKHKTLTPAEMEEKYQRRVAKRAKQ